MKIGSFQQNYNLQFETKENYSFQINTFYSYKQRQMIFGQLPTKSPQKSRNIIKALNYTPLYHMTCRQLSQMKLQYDDILYQNKQVSKIILVGQIVQFEKGVSPRGITTISIRVKDSTGNCNLSFYSQELIQELCKKQGHYMKIALNVKCGGQIYRPQIKLMGISIVELANFNEITQHFLECMKTFIKTQ